MESKNGIPDSPGQQCFASLIEHWAKARLDGPMQAIARYDDVAKLLITIGGFLLAVLAAGYSTMLKEHVVSASSTETRRISVVVFVSMLCFFVCAAGVCVPQPMMQAEKILQLKGSEDLTEDVKNWCKNIDKIIKIKRWLLMLATAFFIISFLVMILLLLNLLG